MRSMPSAASSPRSSSSFSLSLSVNSRSRCFLLSQLKTLKQGLRSRTARSPNDPRETTRPAFVLRRLRSEESRIGISQTNNKQQSPKGASPLDDRHDLTLDEFVVVEVDHAIHEREDRVVSSEANVVPRMILRTPLHFTEVDGVRRSAGDKGRWSRVVRGAGHGDRSVPLSLQAEGRGIWEFAGDGPFDGT